MFFLLSRKVLGISGSLENLGGLQWNLFLCLCFGWLIVYAILRKGLHQSGKVIPNYSFYKTLFYKFLSDYMVCCFISLRSFTNHVGPSHYSRWSWRRPLVLRSTAMGKPLNARPLDRWILANIFRIQHRVRRPTSFRILQ